MFSASASKVSPIRWRRTSFAMLFTSSGITKLLHSIKAKAFAALRVEIHHLGETQKFMYFFKSFNQ